MVEGSNTLLATATCGDCGSVIRLSASTVPDSPEAVFEQFRAAFKGCTACGSDSLKFELEVEA